jgi:hypothetical protein
MLALAVAVWLSPPMGARPARAAGCHAPERPVLAAPLWWERDHRLEARAMTGARPSAPPVLTTIPCPGEVPHLPVAPTASLGPALLVAAEIAPTIRRESLPALHDLMRIEPHPFRLDRPPRCH